MYGLAKYLLYLLIAVGIVSVGLWLIGGKKRQYETNVLIEAAPEVVFPYLTETELMQKWITGLIEVQPTSETSDGVGATARVVMESQGRRFEYNDEVLRYQANKILSVRAKNNSVTSTSIYRLEPQGNDTVLTYTVKETHKGWARLSIPFRKDSVQTRITNDALSLKRLIEQSDSGNGVDQDADDSAADIVQD